MDTLQGDEQIASVPAEVVIVTGDRTGEESTRGAAMHARPRLAVVHLLVWVGCCAVFLGFARVMAERPTGTFGAIFLTLVAAGYGAAWAGLLITLARTFRGARWSIEPGQWLLALVGVVLLVEVLTNMATPRWLRSPRSVIEATAACVFVVPLLDKRLASQWKWLFGALSLLYAFPLVSNLVVGQLNLPNVILRAAAHLTPLRSTAATAIAAVAVSLVDRFGAAHRNNRKEERGWLHWTGIAAVVWLSPLPWVASWLLAG